MTAAEFQDGRAKAYRYDKHIEFQLFDIYGEAVVDQDMDVIDICIEGMYMGEHASQDLYNKVQEFVNENAI